MMEVRKKRASLTRGPAKKTVLAALLAAAIVPPLAASSLDGAGKIVVLPYAVSGMERQSNIYLTNPGDLPIQIDATYVGAEGTPFAASAVGPVACDPIPISMHSGTQISLAKLCPQLATTDLENFGYLEFRAPGGFDVVPFFVTSVVDSAKGGRFAVEGVPASAFDPGRRPALRRSTLRVMGLEGEVSGGQPITRMTHCYLATLGEKKDVTVQLMEYGSGRATPLGNPIKVSLPPSTMTKLGNVLAQAGVLPGRFDNLSAEFYAGPAANSFFDDGAALIAGCSIENLATRVEDFRLAQTPAPRDESRMRDFAAADTRFPVGPFLLGYMMTSGNKASASFYMRHEDRARCWLVPSTLLSGSDPTLWQELRVIDPDGRVVAGGNDITDTGIFSTGVKNGVAAGVNGRWTVEVGWRENVPATTPSTFGNTFGVRCESTSGVSEMLPLPVAPDDF